jgi:hypothetical protein
MAEDILSSFLVKIAYDQDERSRKKFDEGLNQVQTRAAEFGTKIAALPAVVSESTKRISSSLSELWYASQKTGASAEQIDALRRAAIQSGEGPDNAERSWNSFSETLRKFGGAAGQQLKQIFPDIGDYNPKNKFDAFLKARDEFSREYNAAPDKEGKGRVLARGAAFGLGEESAVKGRQDRFNEYFEKQLNRNTGIEAEKAAALTRAYNALADALETVARKADAAVFDKFGAVLDRLTKWLDEDSERIVKFFTELATQIGLVFTDLIKLGPAFTLLWDALKEVGSWLQKIIGQPDGNGLAGVRHLLELISAFVVGRFAITMAAGFITAFAPLTALLAGLAALGIIGVGAYAAGEAVRGWFGGGGGEPGFGGQGGTESAGREGVRRGKMGYRSAGVEESVAGGKGHIAGGGTFDNKAPDIMNKLMAKYDLNREQAAGILGNLGHESAGLSVYHEAGQPEGKGGVGWAQWTGPRRRQFEAWSARHNLDPRSDEASYRYLTEGDPEFAGAVAAVKRQTTVQGSMQAFEASFERAGVKAYSNRMRYAMRAFNAKKPVVAENPLAHWDPNFDQKLKVFKDAKPLGGERHSMNEIHDHRAVDNDVNIHVASASPVDMTARPLSRPRNADLIRNTASYAA